MGMHSDIRQPRIIKASAPGRLELIGNHTDHQGGCVISAALDRRIRATAAPNASTAIRARLGAFGTCTVSLENLAPQNAERGTSAAILRGMAAWGAQRGWQPCGFDLSVESELPAGAGVSSSAAFEVLAGAVIQTLWSGAAPASDDDRLALALGAVEAERAYFGKACGAQDQIACAFGGVLFMDFAADPPRVMRLGTDFARAGYAFALIASGVNHTPFTPDYESVPADMFAVARELGAGKLGETDSRTFEKARATIARTLDERRKAGGAEDASGAAGTDKLEGREEPERDKPDGHSAPESLGELACSRAEHFFAENERVSAARSLLCAPQPGIASFIALANASGRSSERLLQNIVPRRCTPEQARAVEPLERILRFCAARLNPETSAFRIHGGGFGGNVLAVLPVGELEAFMRETDAHLGFSACMQVGVSPDGVRVCTDGDPAAQTDRTADGPREKADRTAIRWTAPSAYGTLEISINLAKPEKDPRAIAAAADGQADAAACDLCRENAEWDAGRERAVNPALSATEFQMDGRKWRIHFSPYGYFREHNIIMTADHRPMHIDAACLRRLLECTDRFPEYFTGSNADLPIVGGSILAHDHFQGGRHVFASMKAPVERPIDLSALAGADAAQKVRCGLVRWPAAMFRLESGDPRALATCAAALLHAWQRFDYPAAGIVGAGHSTVTPIAYRSSFVSAENATDSPTGCSGVPAEMDCTEAVRGSEDCLSAEGASSAAADGRMQSGIEARTPEHPGGDTAAFIEGKFEDGVPGEAAAGFPGASDSCASRPTRTSLREAEGKREDGVPGEADYVCDVVLRNNRTDDAHPWGIFHPGEELHHIKRENIGLIEIMGMAILPPRVLREYPRAATDPASQREIADAFTRILQATGVFPRDRHGNLTPLGEDALAAFLDSFETESEQRQ